MLDYNEFMLTLVRHGQSTTNQNPDLMGQLADTPLSDKGREQAHKLGRRFITLGQKIDYVFSSTYTRAHDTALIALDASCNTTGVTREDIELVHDLREYDAGNWVGASRAETLTLGVKSRMGLLGNGFLPPDGESLHQVERRASKWLEDKILYNANIQKLASQRHLNQETPLNIFCFTHGMTIKCLLHYIMGFDQAFTWKVTVENTSMTRLYFGMDGWRLVSINDCAHLGF